MEEHDRFALALIDEVHVETIDPKIVRSKRKRPLKGLSLYLKHGVFLHTPSRDEHSASAGELSLGTLATVAVPTHFFSNNP